MFDRAGGHGEPMFIIWKSGRGKSNIRRKMGGVMRIGVLALVAVVAAGIAGGALYFSGNQTPAPVRAPLAAQTHALPAAAPAKAEPMFVRGVRRFDDTYRSHRHQFVTVSDYSDRARRNWMVGLFGFAVFVLLTLPKNTRGVRAFYRRMMEHSPLSAEEGVSDDDNRQARKVLFFYLLFLLYQLVQFPLTLGHDNRLQFFTDFAIQSGLLLAVVWTFHCLKRSLHKRWRSDAARREKMDRWLDAKLEGINIRWRDISKLAVGVFIIGFAPAALAHLTGWLDALTDFGQRMVGN